MAGSRDEGTIPAELLTALNKNSPVPLYHQLATALEQAIRDESLPPGARLENEIALGQRLGLSRPTVRRAIQELVDKGLLIRRRGVGTQVVQSGVTRDLGLTSLYEDLSLLGQSPETRVLHHEVRPATAEEAEQLALEPGAPVLHLVRLRLARHVPLAVLDNTLPTDSTDISREDLEEHGLYDLLRHRGVNMRIARQRISAREATPYESELLGIGKDAAVLTMSRTAIDTTGRVVEFGRHCYRPDLYSFEITLVDR
ncbi:GntR family transcriptional regulator [Leifsonia shinshuensis]|uniref:GntR family transcriptional regulator n=1 Tax=Leifsonia TaxID=110932 RepID=UPI002864A92A|nr:GntR family transcriptional regulator [Leifsonia shinshuensis]MDR6971635.1 GntR family transcriptional regulator [Leifsonia shinshuensis]